MANVPFSLGGFCTLECAILIKLFSLLAENDAIFRHSRARLGEAVFNLFLTIS